MQRGSNHDIANSYKTKGCIIRSRAKCVEFGERNSCYFINLEKRNQRQKVITKIVTAMFLLMLKIFFMRR